MDGVEGVCKLFWGWVMVSCLKLKIENWGRANGQYASVELV